MLYRTHSLPINSISIYSNKQWVMVGVLVAFIILLYLTPLMAIVQLWAIRDDYSHGFLIPLISLYLVWVEKERLKALPVRPNIPLGTVLTFLGCLILVIGTIGNAIVLGELSIIVTLSGLVLLLLGGRLLKALCLPLLYLVFMIPVTDWFIEGIHWPFQLFSANVSAILLKLLNIPVFLDVQFLKLPNRTLEVARECSGVHFLVAIIAIGIPLAYFTQRNWRRGTLLVAFAVIIGIFANALRITLIGIWAYHGGEVVHGPFHIFKGVFVSMVGFIFLFIGAWLLARIPSSDTSHSQEKADVKKEFAGFNEKKFKKAWVLSIALLLGFSGFLSMYKADQVPLKVPLNYIPHRIGEWKGKKADLQEARFRAYGADYELARLYRNNEGHEYNLYVGYLGSQEIGRRMLVESKLNELHARSTVFDIVIDGFGSVRVNKAVVDFGHRNAQVFFLYDVNGRLIASKYRVKLLTAFEGLFHNRTNGSVIVVVKNVRGGNSLDSSSDTDIRFLSSIIPLLTRYL